MYTFGSFEFTTDIFNSAVPIVDKTLSLEILETPDLKKPEYKNKKVIAKTQFQMKDALAKACGCMGVIKLFCLDDKMKYNGKLEVSQFSARRYFTFFDLVFKNQLNIVPILAVDFSMANLTMNDAGILHTLKPGAPNDYIEAIKGVQQAFAPLSKFKLAYGFGARTHVRGEG